jgi:hypothetical protein
MSAELRMKIADEVKEVVAEFFPSERMSFPAEMLIVTGDKPV